MPNAGQSCISQDIWEWDSSGRFAELLDKRYPRAADGYDDHLPAQVDSWDPDTVVQADPKGPFVDMPTGDGLRPFVSTKFRNVLERVAAGQAQYLRVIPVNRKKPLPLEPYWVVNWLTMVDCIDFSQTRHERVSRTPHALILYELPSIIQSRIEPGIHLFSARYDYNRLIVSDIVKEAVQREQCRGVYFGPVRLI